MKTRVYSKAALPYKNPKSNLQAYKVVIEDHVGREERCFEEPRSAHSFATRRAKTTNGKVYIYENTGGMQFVLLAVYEGTQPYVPTKREQVMAKAEAAVLAVGKTVDERWLFAANNDKVPVVVRFRKREVEMCNA